MNKRFLIISSLSLFFIFIGTVSILVFLEIQQANSEGLAFAKKHDQRACVREVIKGERICTKLSCFLNNRYFFQTCMANAKLSASLCKSVPPIRNLFQFEAWKNKQCNKTGRTDRGCHHIWQKVRNSCKAAEKLRDSETEL